MLSIMVIRDDPSQLIFSPAKISSPSPQVSSASSLHVQRDEVENRLECRLAAIINGEEQMSADEH